MKVESRQHIVLSTATRTSAIVSSLFPSEVHDRLYPQPSDEHVPHNRGGFRNGLRNGLPIPEGGTVDSNVQSTLVASPIASLYPDTTVLFADIVGFTSWSAVRSPTQVFCLLETLYGAFDEIARQRGVFKVETIGDSYVAVAGLPTPRKHHAVVIARFASDWPICLRLKHGLLQAEPRAIPTGPSMKTQKRPIYLELRLLVDVKSSDSV